MPPPGRCLPGGRDPGPWAGSKPRFCMSRRAWWWLPVAGLALMLQAGVAGAQNATPDGISHPTVYEARSLGIHLGEFWVREPAAGASVTAGYFHLENRSDATIRLIGIDSPVAEAVELHDLVANAGGVMRMRPLTSGLTVPPGGAEVLEPGGRHVMLIGLRQALTTDSVVPLTLRFADGLAVEVKAPVYPASRAQPSQGAGSAREHSHDNPDEEHHE